MVFNRLRYLLQRLSYAGQLGAKVGSKSDNLFPWRELTHVIDSRIWREPLTDVIDFIGVSMSPTLNPRGQKDRDAVDHLLLRRIAFPSVNTCRVGDVVAFDSPYRFGDQQSILIRRIAAMPGDQMLSDSIQFEPFLIPHGFCWVLADNLQCEPSDVVDSRFFGPLPLANIRGRVIYSAYDERDHGPVVNSPQSMASDEVLLKYELSLERLYKRSSL